MAILVATKGFLIPAEPAVAWEALSNIRHWKKWDRSIHEVELLETPKPGALGRIAFKPNSSRLLKITEVQPSRRLEWEFEGALGSWIHQCAIIENAEGAIVTFNVNYHGSWERFVGRFAENRTIARLEERGMRFAVVCKEISANRNIHQHIAQELNKAAC